MPTETARKLLNALRDPAITGPARMRPPGLSSTRPAMFRRHKPLGPALYARTWQAEPSAADQICFLCQQSAEKYLKAILEEAGQPIPKTHDLLVFFVLIQALVVSQFA